MFDIPEIQDYKSLGDNTKYQISFVDKIDDETERKMTNELIAYEAKHGIDVNYQRFSVVISDEKEVIFGVINAYTAFAEIYIDDIWVDSVYRGKGYGRQLLSALENHFKGQGFNNINLVTSAFQAPEFYKKCGYTAEFTRLNNKNPKLSKTFFVKFFNEDSETKGIFKAETS
ncbi:TPA: GNAT family N-acetyltransferase [Legionella pneumophila]|nr:GNAT family N-acetyltransferase [Legionella pneumophila]